MIVVRRKWALYRSQRWHGLTALGRPNALDAEEAMESLQPGGNPNLSSSFVALDFETADHGRDSACAIALVRVERGQIVQREYSLLRPPRSCFRFSHIHGITWADVENQPTFAEAWPSLQRFLEGASFVAAHNSPFDRSVLEACCRVAGFKLPAVPFVCTMRLARQTWEIYPTGLQNVCTRLHIPLRHHHAGSDAEACARIVLEAHRKSARSRQRSRPVHSA